MRHLGRHAGKHPLLWLLLALLAALALLLLPAGPAHGKSSGHGSGRGHSSGQSSGGSAVSFGHARDGRAAGAHPATRTAASPASGRAGSSCPRRDERGNCISHAQGSGAAGSQALRSSPGWGAESGAQAVP